MTEDQLLVCFFCRQASDEYFRACSSVGSAFRDSRSTRPCIELPGIQIELRIAVAAARQRGYATAQEQLEYGVVAIAVPIRDTQGRVIAAVNCSSELSRNNLETLVATRLGPIRDAAKQIERALERFPALSHLISGSMV